MRRLMVSPGIRTNPQTSCIDGIIFKVDSSIAANGERSDLFFRCLAIENTGKKETNGKEQDDTKSAKAGEPFDNA